MPRVKMLMLVDRKNSKEVLQRMSKLLTEECGATDKRLMLIRQLDDKKNRIQNT